MSEEVNAEQAVPEGAEQTGEATEKSDQKVNPTPEQKEAARKFKLKFGKDERELEEKDVIALAQKGWASDERFQQAAAEKRRIQNLAKRFKDDPDSFAKAIGIEDPVKFYRDRLEKEIRRRTMDPRERELEDRELALRAKEEEIKAKEREQHEERVEKLKGQYQVQYDKEIADAITSSGLPKNPRTVRRFAELALKSLENGGYKMPWNVISNIVRDEYSESLRELTGAFDEDKLFEFFGQDVVKKVQAADMKRRIPGAKVQDEKQTPKPQANQKDTKSMSPDEFREYIKNFR